MPGCARWIGAFWVAATSAVLPRPAQAQRAELRPLPRHEAPPDPPSVDRFELTAESQTYLRLFRRALLPGAAGALVTTETAAPFTEYLSARAANVDSPWQRDALDVEFAAWGQVWPTGSGYERPFDGDVQAANVRYRFGPAWLRVGRQTAAGGAARFSRFDGVSVGGVLPSGMLATAYGGATVLPRWDALPGYHQLGKAERELLQGAPLRLDRGDQWLAGARVGYQNPRIGGALSFHEQRDGAGLGRRNLGLDLSGQLIPELGYGASALLELSARRLADLRTWVDWVPLRSLSLTLEALRTEPSLFLSRQSVLSVFSTEGYTEVGGFISVRALTWLRLDGSAYGQRFDVGRDGARMELTARVEPDRFRATVLRLTYGRVLIGDVGYQSVRASLAQRLVRSLRATGELYGYFYDQPVQGYRASSVYAGTLGYDATERLALLLGASLARSPYSRLDAQTMLRLSYELDARPRERAW